MRSWRMVRTETRLVDLASWRARACWMRVRFIDYMVASMLFVRLVRSSALPIDCVQFHTYSSYMLTSPEH